MALTTVVRGRAYDWSHAIGRGAATGTGFNYVQTMCLGRDNDLYTANRDAERPSGLAVAFAMLEELGHQFLVAGSAHPDAVHPHAEIVLVAAVRGIEIAVLAQAHRLHVVEAGAGRRATPDGMAPVISPALNDCG